MNFPVSDLLDLALKASLVLGAATILTLALRKSSAALRHLVWFAAVVGILVLPIAARLSTLEVTWFPRWEAEPAPALIVPVKPVREAPIPSGTEVAALTARMPAPSASVAEPSMKLPQQNWTVNIWLAGALACMLPYLIGLLRLSRTTRTAKGIDDGLQSDVEHACERLSLNRRVTVKIGVNVRMPMTWGALFPVVLLPPEFADWTERRRRIVLLHELAHVKRFDWFTQMLAGVAAAIHWFNPLAWLAARRMRIEREQACDDLVLRSGSRASDYADELLQIANAFGSQRWNNQAAIPMARRSSLEGRLRFILTDGRERRTLTRWIILAAFIVMTGIVLPISMLRAAEKKPAETETRESSTVRELALAANRLGVKRVIVNLISDGRINLQTSGWSVEADTGEVIANNGNLKFSGNVALRNKDGTTSHSDTLIVGPNGGITLNGNIEMTALAHPEVIASPPNADLREFVRLVRGEDGYTFEGAPVREKSIHDILSKVPNRPQTVLELAVTSDETSWREVNEMNTHYGQIAHELGFEYASFIGVQKAASKGSPAQTRTQTTSDSGGSTRKNAGELQKRLVEIAKQRMESMRHLVDAGEATEDDYFEAAYAYEVARNPGNELRQAELKVKLLDDRHRRLLARRSITPTAEIEKAEMAKLQAELEYLRLKEESTRRINSRQDPDNSTEYWNSVAARHQDPGLNNC